MNRNLKAALKIFHHESQNTWDENLLWLLLAFNTAVHDSTRYIPDVLFLGRELKCPLAVRWDLSPGSDVDNVCHTNQFWTRACGNLLAARKRVAQRFNEGQKPHHYSVGDLVRYQLWLSSSKGQNISAKLLLRWSVIAKIVRPNVVLLSNPDAGVIRRAHVSQLKPCYT